MYKYEYSFGQQKTRIAFFVKKFYGFITKEE